MASQLAMTDGGLGGTNADAHRHLGRTAPVLLQSAVVVPQVSSVTIAVITSAVTYWTTASGAYTFTTTTGSRCPRWDGPNWYQGYCADAALGMRQGGLHCHIRAMCPFACPAQPPRRRIGPSRGRQTNLLVVSAALRCRRSLETRLPRARNPLIGGVCFTQLLSPKLHVLFRRWR